MLAVCLTAATLAACATAVGTSDRATRREVAPQALASPSPLPPEGPAGCDTGQPEARRIAGPDRIATALALARAAWGGRGAATVVLASARSFPDALGATPWAAAHDAPVLLSEPDALPEAVRAALADLGTQRVVIVGGPAAIGEAVEARLVEDGFDVTRLAGEDRFATAAAIARDLHDTASEVVVVSGRTFADAVAAGPLLVPVPHVPALLTEADHLTEATRAALADLGVERATIVGGAAAVGEQVDAELSGMGIATDRIAGEDRYATSTAVVDAAATGSGERTSVATVTGADFPDALAANAYAAARAATVLLVDPDDLIDHPATSTVLRHRGSAWRCVDVVGAEGAVGVRVAEQVAAATGAWPPDGDPVLLAAGDIASCGLTGDDATAALLDGLDGTVLTLGDNAYDDGTTPQYRDCYLPTWGRHLVRTRASLGNHDIRTADGGPTYDLFGVRAGPRGEGWYAFDLGPGWRVLVLNSNCPGTVACAEGSPQYAWLASQLDAASDRHVIVATHHPRWSSGAYAPGETRVDPLWRLAAQHGVDLWLAGHEHGYERFAPKDADGNADVSGVQQLTAGTGGASLRPFGEPQPGSERTVVAHGVLELTLHRGGYTWRLLDTAGSVRDEGTRALG